MSASWMTALGGGALIGAAAALLLLTHGRIAGVSGIVGTLLDPAMTDRAWRYAFVGGLALAGVIAAISAPGVAPDRSLVVTLAGGLLVGYGSRLAGGCTSGHGVCGLSRLAPRSLLAVATFVTTGAITATLRGALS